MFEVGFIFKTKKKVSNYIDWFMIVFPILYLALYISIPLIMIIINNQ